MRKNVENKDKKLATFTIAALSGGSGKTIASLSITRALKNRGLNITSFKKGPDYIDAAWLAAASGNKCYNLDPFLMNESTIRASFNLRAKKADVAIVEGNRGLFDGMDIKGSASTAKLSKMLNSPVLLVVDCTKSTRTVAATVLGCMRFDPSLDFIGVILNRISGPRHRKIVTEAVEAYTDLPVLGFFPRLKKDPLPMRHLGLTPADEFSAPSEAVDELAKLAEKHVDLERIVRLGTRNKTHSKSISSVEKLLNINPGIYQGLKIGIIKDSAFQFYYPENLEALELLGAQLIFLNALTDSSIPPIDGLYIGGGFPETQAEALMANESFRKNLLTQIQNGLPVYAECGGLMYLGQSIDWEKKRYQMVGATPFCFEMKRKPAGHGYTVLKFDSDSPFYDKGAVIKGHEFHYSKPVLNKKTGKGGFSCKVLRGTGFDGESEGFVYRNTFSTYTHIHALGQKEWPKVFLNKVAEGKRAGN